MLVTPAGPGPGSAFGAEYVRAYFREVDTMRPDALAAWYASDGSFRFANSDPVIGHRAIMKLLGAFYATVRSMHHRELGVWTTADSGVFEAEVAFQTADGRTVQLPAVSILRVANGLISDFRFVMDASPLAADSV